MALLESSGQTVIVNGFAPSAGPTLPKCVVGTAGTVYTDPVDNRSYLLVVHQALCAGDHVRGSLWNPFQMRCHGVLVDEVALQHSDSSSHSITIPTDVGSLLIPLRLAGTMSGFDTRKPTDEEILTLPRVEVTSPIPWNPYDPVHASNELAATRRRDGSHSVSTVSTIPSMHDGPPFEATLLRQVASARAITRRAERIVERGEVSSTGFGDDEEEVDDDLATRLIGSVSVATIALDQPLSEADFGTDDVPEEATTRHVYALSSSERASVISPELLSRRWRIGLDAAKRTLKVTTQAGVRNIYAPSERRLRTKSAFLRAPTLRGRFYSDTMFAKVKSVTNAKCAQVFTDGYGYDRFYPLASKGDAPKSLTRFIQDAGIPQTLVTDNANELTGGNFKKICNDYQIERRLVTPYHQWHNKAEASVREIKVSIRRMIRTSGAPRRLWCYAGQWVTALRRLTALDIPQLEGRVPTERVLGSTPDISLYALFGFYEPVWYIQPTSDFPHEKRTLGMILGPYESSADEGSFLIMRETGQVVVRKSVYALTTEDRNNPSVTESIDKLKKGIRETIGDSVAESDVPAEARSSIGDDPPGDLFEDEPTAPLFPGEEARKGVDDFTPEALDEYLSAELLLPHRGEMRKGRVISRRRDVQGNPIGTRDTNPILDTRCYDVKFDDGSIDAFSANTIAENLYSQVDEHGRSFAILRDIVGHRTTADAVPKTAGTFLDRNGQERLVKTTAGWELEVEWRDGSTDWVSLKDLKDSNPLQVAEYATANQLQDEPAFAWWVRKALMRRDRLIKKVKSRYWKRTHKYGVEIPKTVQQALDIDRRTNTTFWRDAIEKEMRNVMPAFELSDDNSIPIGYQKIVCHMVFDVKMIGLVRKARFVAGGHMTEPPKESTYSSVVSRDSVRLAFLLAALNDLEILAADVQNAYLNAPTKERVYTIAGLEFGAENVGRPVKIVRALYGLKSSGARWRDHMAATLREAGFASSRADADMWMRSAVKPDGSKYYEYVLVYVDDILAISLQPRRIMDYLEQHYQLKAGSVGQPTTYLGADIKRQEYTDSEGRSRANWTMSSDTYVKRAVADVTKELEKIGEALDTAKRSVPTPMASGYRPELDATPLLDPSKANYFQGLIGVLRWICELGRLDIIVPTSLLSRYLAAPRVGHLEQAIHIFAYLNKKDRSCLVFDEEPMTPSTDQPFQKCDWSEYYPGAAEAIPPDAPEPRGKPVSMTCFVDADHAGCQVTRRSHTGVVIYVQSAPILWFSKRQNTVETSTFGSEFVAAKIAVEMIEGLRYKLRMLGVEIEGSTNLYIDNESVVKSATRPESTLKKKHNAIAYHRVREAQAADVIQIGWVESGKNHADLLTKLMAGPQLKEVSSLSMSRRFIEAVGTKRPRPEDPD